MDERLCIRDEKGKCVADPYLERIKALGSNITEITDAETLEKVFREIDFCYSLMETPHVFKSRKKDMPSVLIYQGTVWRVQEPKEVIKKLGMKKV
jgi:hypothetical protein